MQQFIAILSPGLRPFHQLLLFSILWKGPCDAGILTKNPRRPGSSMKWMRCYFLSNQPERAHAHITCIYKYRHYWVLRGDLPTLPVTSFFPCDRFGVPVPPQSWFCLNYRLVLLPVLCVSSWSMLTGRCHNCRKLSVLICISLPYLLVNPGSMTLLQSVSPLVGTWTAFSELCVRPPGLLGRKRSFQSVTSVFFVCVCFFLFP